LPRKSIPAVARDRRNNKRQIIINGSTASQQEYPYASSILFGSKHLCGASLIAPDIVLSAAHCFQKSIAWNHYRDRLQIVVGEYHLQDQDDGGESFSIETIDLHPDYIETPNYLENDAVVIQLSGESRRRIVKLNQHDLSSLGMGNQGDAFTVLGWGSLDKNGTIFANVLQEVNLGYISNDECQHRGVPVVTDQMICAVDLDEDGKTEDSCYGDSGGPMILSNSYPPAANHKKDIQVGIVSFGSKVCGMFPGVYTRISSVFDWIRERVCALSKNPPNYFRCDDLFAFTTVAPTTSYTLAINLTNVPSPSATMLQPELHQNLEDSGVNDSIVSTISNHYESPLSKTTNEPTPAGVSVTNQTLDSQHDDQDIDAVVSVTHNSTTDETTIESPWGDHDNELSSSASYDSLLVLSSVQGILMVSCFVLTTLLLW
jgi:Secreted trypsin-like serine protease